MTALSAMRRRHAQWKNLPHRQSTHFLGADPAQGEPTKDAGAPAVAGLACEAASGSADSACIGDTAGRDSTAMLLSL